MIDVINFFLIKIKKKQRNDKIWDIMEFSMCEDVAEETKDFLEFLGGWIALKCRHEPSDLSAGRNFIESWIVPFVLDL